VDILCKEFSVIRGVNVLKFQSHHYLSGYEIKWQKQTVVAYLSNWLSASHAILAGITFPPKPWPMTLTFGSSRLILVGLGNLQFLQVNPVVGLGNLRFLQVNPGWAG
jgi:hypothetical protein